MAVYTTLTPDEIADFLLPYDIGALVSAEGIAEGIENTNYLLVTKKDGRDTRYILTVFEQRVLGGDVPFFLALTQLLHTRGIPCPRPISTQDGDMVRSLKGKKAALVEFLEGSNKTPITPAHLSEVGELAAKMHLAGKDTGGLKRANTMGIDAWGKLFDRCKGKLDGIAPGLEKEIAGEMDFLRANWPTNLPSGIIHADIFPDNVFFKNDKLSGIIDFYFACNDFWIYDLLICLNAWCFDMDHRFVTERGKALWQGYAKHRPITADERASIPVLARGVAVRFLATRAYDWLHPVPGATVTLKDPKEYVAKLRFLRAVKNAGELGL